jgi:uncharacterized membrane protein YdfJ with MMPL/SSD domain
MLLPAVLELLGPTTWRLPRWLDTRLPHINIEGAAARTQRSAGSVEVRETLDGAVAKTQPAPTELASRR